MLMTNKKRSKKVTPRSNGVPKIRPGMLKKLYSGYLWRQATWDKMNPKCQFNK